MGSKTIDTSARRWSIDSDSLGEQEHQQSCKLFIGGLSYDTTDASLSRYFENYGQVASAVVMRDAATFRSRGFGFVTFCTLKAASEVVNYQKHVIDGRKVEAKFAVPRSSVSKSSGCSVQSASKHMKCTKLDQKITSMSKNFTNDYVHTSPIGETESIAGSIRSNRTTRTQSLTKTESSLVSNGSKNSRYRARSFSSLSSGERKLDGIIPNKIFVGGLLYATGHESLRDYFEQFGEVEMAEVIYNRDTKKSRGFGFVVFKSFDAVQKVLQEQQIDMLIVDGKQVEVKHCVARHEASSVANNIAFELELVQIDSANKAENSASMQINAVQTIASSAENQWKKKPALTAIGNAIGNGIRNIKFNGADSFSPLNTMHNNGSMHLDISNYESRDEIADDLDAFERGSLGAKDLFCVEPLLDHVSEFSGMNSNTGLFQSGLPSPLASPLASPFTNGFAEDVASVSSFFTNPSLDDTWGTSERKYSIDEYACESCGSKRDTGYDAAFMDASEGLLSPFSEMCSSPISTGVNSGLSTLTQQIAGHSSHGMKGFSLGQQPSFANTRSNSSFSMFSGTFEKHHA